MRRPFQTLDVFTSARMGGNPLAIIDRASDLDTVQMQAIARDFGLSETIFILPPQTPQGHARLRIFTPETELPFAGHPLVGAAYALASQAPISQPDAPDGFLFETPAGPVLARAQREDGQVVGAFCRAPQGLHIGDEVGTADVAALCGLRELDILRGRFHPRFLGVGTPFLCAEITHAALEDAAPDAAAFAALHQRLFEFQSGPAPFLGLHLHARDSNDPSRIDCRMFAPLSGIAEDPATGSAAAALCAYLHSLRPDQTDFTLFQGRHIERPSEIQVKIRPTPEMADGAAKILAEIWIGGQCQPIANGELDA